MLKRGREGERVGELPGRTRVLEIQKERDG